MAQLLYRHPKTQAEHLVDPDRTAQRLILERAGFKIVKESAPVVMVADSTPTEPEFQLPPELIAMVGDIYAEEDFPFLTDEELLEIDKFGPKKLAAWRQVYPTPAE